MAGFFEFSLMRTRGDLDQKALSELFHQYLNVEEEFVKALFTEGETQLGRVFVQEPVLSSDDNISHTAFSDDGDCPESHPYRIPRLQIELEFDLDIDTDWRLSSDHDGMEQGMSLHADYMAAWTDDPPGT